MALSEEQIKRIASNLTDPRDEREKERRRIEAESKARMQRELGEIQGGFASDIGAILAGFKKPFKRDTYEKLGEKANELLYPNRGFTDQEINKYDTQFTGLMSLQDEARERISSGEDRAKVVEDLERKFKERKDIPWSTKLKGKTKWLGEMATSIAELTSLGTEFLGNKIADKTGQKTFTQLSNEIVRTKIGDKLADIGGKMINSVKPNSPEEAAAMKELDKLTLVFGEVAGLKDASKVSKSVARLKRAGVSDKEVGKIINKGLQIEEQDLARIARNYGSEVAVGIEKTNNPKIAKKFIDMDVDFGEIEKYTHNIKKLSEEDKDTIIEYSSYIFEGAYKKKINPDLEASARDLAEKLDIQAPKQKQPVLADRLLEVAERDEMLDDTKNLYRNIAVEPNQLPDYPSTVATRDEVGRFTGSRRLDTLQEEIAKAKAEGKSFDEFVKGQGDTSYRYTPKSFDKSKFKESGANMGLWVSDDVERTKKLFSGEDFGINKGKRFLEEIVIDKNAKILHQDKIPEKVLANIPDTNKSNRVAQWAKDNGYDVAEYYGDKIILNKNIIKTKSQLKQLWEGGGPTGEFAKPYLKHTPAAFAGFDKDEDGNIYYDHKKAVVAIGGVSLAGHPKMKSKITKIVKSIRNKIDPKEAKELLNTKTKKEIVETFRKLDPLEPKPENAPIFRNFRKKVEEKWTTVRETIQDDWVRQRKLQEEKGVDLTFNPLQKKTQYAGRKGTRQELLFDEVANIDREIKDIAKEIDIPDSELYKKANDFLIARHAPERNAALGEKAAGITTEEANKTLEAIKNSGQYPVVKKVAERINDLHNQTLDLMLDGQLIDRETYTALRKKYPNHIPLNRVFSEEEDLVQVLTSKGLDVKGSGLKRAKGSEREVDDILTNVSANLSATITRVEKNRINLEVLGFARKNKELGLFEEIKPKVIGKGFDDQPIFAEIKDPLVLSIRENGKPVYLRIADEDMATMYKGVGTEQMGFLLRTTSAITRFYSATATRFNVAFAPSNVIRDSQELAVYLSSVKDIGLVGAAQAAKEIPASMKDVINYMRGKDTAGAKLYEEMKLAGGTTGGFSASTKKQLEVNFQKIKKLNRSNLRKALESIIRGIDNYNTVAEDATRLAAYKIAKKKGMNIEEAAVLAKEATIDFNKNGTGGSVMNAIWMFSNASMQGSAKMLKAFKNPKVLGTTVATVTGAVWAVNRHNDSVDPDWREKVTTWDRNSNLPIMIKTDEGVKYITIPVSWGLKPIKVMADASYDSVNGYSRGILDTAGSLVASVIEGYNPLGGSDIASAITPTVLDLPIEVSNNKAWHGGMIKPDWKEDLPGADQYFASTEETMIGGAFVAATGVISEKTSRVIDVSPEDLLYVSEQLVGGAGRVAGQFFNTITSIGTDKEVTANDIPFVSRFYKTKDEERVEQTKKRIRHDKTVKELKRFKTGSDEQKNYIKEYFKSLDTDEEISSEYFKLREGGFDLSGIKKSKEQLLIEPVFKEALIHVQAGRTDKADEIYFRLSEPEREAFKKYRTSWRAKHSSELRDLLKEDPNKALEYLRNLPTDSEKNRVFDNLEEENKDLLRSAASVNPK